MNLEPTPHEQYFLELVNRARLNPEEEATLYEIDLNEDLDQNTTISEARQPEEPNQYTISPEAKQPLAFNPLLLEAALNHSHWMLDTNTFSHTGFDGSSPSERAENAGYPSSFVGENIAWRGTTGNVDNLTRFVENLHQGLFLSPSHRLNLMKPDYQEVGVGVATGNFTNEGTDWKAVMVSQEFGKDFNNDNFFITGIVYDDIDESNFYEPGEGLSDLTVEVASTTDDFTATTTTRIAGGYQMAVPSGEYEVKFTGAGLEREIIEIVTVADRNVKVDIVANNLNLEEENFESETPPNHEATIFGEVTLAQDHLTFQTPLSQFRNGATDTEWIRANPQEVDLGEHLATESLTVTNSGEGDLTLQEIRLPDVEGLRQETPFAGDEILAPGESQTYTFSFNPTEAGLNLEGEQITLITDDPEQDEINISLFGHSTHQADISYEGDVNLNDLGRLASSFRSQDTPYDPTADINFDGQISATDLEILSAELGNLI